MADGRWQIEKSEIYSLTLPLSPGGEVWGVI